MKFLFAKLQCKHFLTDHGEYRSNSKPSALRWTARELSIFCQPKWVHVLSHCTCWTHKSKMDKAIGGVQCQHIWWVWINIWAHIVKNKDAGSDQSKHLTMEVVLCLGVHYYTWMKRKISTLLLFPHLFLLMNPLSAMKHDLGTELYVDVTHKVFHHLWLILHRWQ